MCYAEYNILTQVNQVDESNKSQEQANQESLDNLSQQLTVQSQQQKH